NLQRIISYCMQACLPTICCASSVRKACAKTTHRFAATCSAAESEPLFKTSSTWLSGLFDMRAVYTLTSESTVPGHRCWRGFTGRLHDTDMMQETLWNDLSSARSVWHSWI